MTITNAWAAIAPMADKDPGSGPHLPSIGDFFPTPIFGAGTFFQLDRIMLVRVICGILLLAVFLWWSKGVRIVPGRKQGFAEMCIDFVRVQISEEMLGKDAAKKYFPLLLTIFYIVLVFNLSGIVPGLNIASTSRIGLPLLLALWVYVMYLVGGVKAHGLGGFLRTQLLPPGLPKFLYILITPIEILQVFVFRPATLALRLTANMISGHILLALCFAATNFLFLDAAALMKPLGALTLLGGFIFTLFEVMVAVLQAYVFALLTAAYINMSISAEH